MSNSYVTDEQLNQLSQRSIKSGKEYNNLIPKTYCKGSFSGKGDTSFSVEEIAYMIEQYYWQMEKVAPLLLSSSLNNTSDNIHKFIYWHFQYWADDKTQNLRSPACSWHTRKKGIDCKSYSILAGSILKCLGINFYIRQIKQATYYPEYFTHVYIIVPHNQTSNSLNDGYYVIDGTINPSIETMIVAKKDKFMSGLRHMRLNGVAPVNGVVHATPNRRPRGLQITTNNQQGLGFAVTTIAAGVTAAEELGLVDTGALYENTIGAVLANGLDFSCWGSTYTSTDSEQWISQDLATFYNDSVGKGLTLQNIHNFIDVCNWITKQAYQYGGKMKSCSQKALYAFGDAAREARIKLVSQLKSNGFTQISDVTVPAGTKLPFDFTDKNFDVYDKSYTSQRFKTGSTTSSNTNTSSSNSKGIQITSPSNQYTTTTETTENVQQAGLGGSAKMVGYGLGLTAAIIGGKYLYDNYIKNQTPKVAK